MADLPRVYDVFLASLEVNLVDLTLADQSQQTSAGNVRITPVRQALY